MKIDALTLKKLLLILYNRYFDFQQIVLKGIQLEIDEYIKINLILDYYHVETKIKVIGKVHVDNDIIIDAKGMIQYGFIHFDFYKMLEEYLQNNRYISIKDKQIRIKNEYLKDIHINEHYVELELL